MKHSVVLAIAAASVVAAGCSASGDQAPSSDGRRVDGVQPPGFNGQSPLGNPQQAAFSPNNPSSNGAQPTLSGTPGSGQASCRTFCTRLEARCHTDCAQFCDYTDLLGGLCGGPLTELLECALTSNLSCGEGDEVAIGPCRRELEDLQECLDGPFQDGPPSQEGDPPSIIPDNPPPDSGER
jgi:hypothetical protein